MPTSTQGRLDPQTQDFYRRSLLALETARIRFLVGGAYASARYTGIGRHTKDLDLFVRQGDLEEALHVLSRAGFRTEVTFPHWLGKAFSGGDLVDVIHGSGNGIAAVDDEWFAHAVPDEVLGIPVELCPPEEMIWSKAFIMERERFDGADILHLLRSCAGTLDWKRLLDRFGPHYRVLLAHLVLFGYVYPSERRAIPGRVMSELVRRFTTEERSASPARRLCRGTLLSRAQFLVDVAEWGYEDARLDPTVGMSSEHIAIWTDAIAEEMRTYEDADRNGTHSGHR